MNLITNDDLIIKSYTNFLKYYENNEETLIQYTIFMIYTFYILVSKNSKFKPILCKTHILINMVDVKHPKCCVCNETRPTFNYPSQKPAKYCKTCKTHDMVDVNHDKCGSCKQTRPSFNYPNKLIPSHCDDCKLDGMINIVSRKCNCGKHQPRFNYPDTYPANYCGECKLIDMVNIIDKKCITCGLYEGSFNLPNKFPAEYCWNCSTEYMINVKQKKCECKDCTDPAYYNYHGKSPIYCSKHKLPKMITLPTKQCINKECKDLAIYGIVRPEYCKKHKEEIKNSLLTSVEKKCEKCDLKLLLNDDKICSYCSGYYIKKHEITIKQLFDINNILYTYYNICINGIHFPDFIFKLIFHMIIVEVDEHQHKNKKYKDKEIKRMITITESQKVPVIFIRYNPDNYQSFNKQKLIDGDKRKDILLKQLDYCMNLKDVKDKLLVMYLFYDNFDLNNIKLIPIKLQ